MDLKKLQEENAALRKELMESRTLYNQLVQETSHEKFDERRVNLLKSQVIQLERQLLLMSDALACRSRSLLEVENSLTWLADRCRSLIALVIPGPDVPVPRSSLTEMVEKLESTRIKLYKNIENTSQETLSKRLMFFNDFVKPSKLGEITLFDICSGNLDHVNMKQVAKLESRLCQLYKDLVAVHQSLTCPQTDHRVTRDLTCPVIADRLSTQVLTAMARLEDCTQDLLSLSLLFPAAPWPPLKRPVSKELTSDRVISSLPTLPRSKAAEVHKVIEALTKVTNHRLHTQGQEVKALRDEVKFHNSMYSLQNEYTGALFEAVKTGYKDFEVNVEESLCKPVSDILLAYNELKNTSSEEALRVFLTCMKDRSENLESTISSLSQTEDSSGQSPGVEGLSAFGKDFFTSLNKLCEEVKSVRDKNARENRTLKEEQEKLDSDLAQLLDQNKAAKESGELQVGKDTGSGARKMLLKNKQEGPPAELHQKSSDGSLQVSGISTQLDKMTLDSSPTKECDGDSDSSSVSSHGSSKPRPPSARGPQSSAKSPVRYSANRTLNLRRSGSLTRGSQSKHAAPNTLRGQTNQNSQSKSCVADDTDRPGTRATPDASSGNTKVRKDNGKTGIPAVNTSATSRRKIPTLKAPFR